MEGFSQKIDNEVLPETIMPLAVFLLEDDKVFCHSESAALTHVLNSNEVGMAKTSHRALLRSMVTSTMAALTDISVCLNLEGNAVVYKELHRVACCNGVRA